MALSASFPLKWVPLAVAGFAIAVAAPPAAAQREPEDPSIVPLFMQTCTRPGMDADAILAGVTNSPDWVEVASPTVDLRGLEQIPSRLMTSALRRTGTTRQWHRTVNGRELTLVVASMEERSFWHHVCILLAPDIRSAWPYFDTFENGMEAIGLSAKSTDLPHYKEFGGRLADKRQAHADIFSRSRAVTTPETMHLSIVFE
jgi:hypothetical protein